VLDTARGRKMIPVEVEFPVDQGEGLGSHMPKLYHIFIVFMAYIIYNVNIFMEDDPWD
jgi:hypothetical protein